MKFVAIAIVAMMGLPGCAAPAAAEDGYIPPKIGMQLNWMYQMGDSESAGISAVVIATGPDVAIFLARDASGVEDDYYFAEFSGIDPVGCLETMPSAADRQELAAMWPLTPGAVYQGETYQITVEDKSTVQLNGDSEPVAALKVDYLASRRDASLRYVSPKLNTIVRTDYGGGAVDRLASVEYLETEAAELRPGVHLQKGLDVSTLQNCAALLTAAD